MTAPPRRTPISVPRRVTTGTSAGLEPVRQEDSRRSGSALRASGEHVITCELLEHLGADDVDPREQRGRRPRVKAGRDEMVESAGTIRGKDRKRENEQQDQQRA